MLNSIADYYVISSDVIVIEAESAELQKKEYVLQSTQEAINKTPQDVAHNIVMTSSFDESLLRIRRKTPSRETDRLIARHKTVVILLYKSETIYFVTPLNL